MTGADLVIVGAGLSGGLLAWRLAEVRPELNFIAVEAGTKAGGNHTWSFHDGDLTADGAKWLAPFVVHRWPSYEVRFPARRRTIGTGYATVTSDRFHEILQGRLGDRLRLNAPVETIAPTSVVLAGGERIEAGAVIDARGPRALAHLDVGYQKFLGQEVEFERPHGLAAPIVMDATVAQDDGYRFVYSLPFSSTRMLIEDTYYADGDALAQEGLRKRIADYAARAGWGSFRVVREEEGILPIALGGDYPAHLASLGGVPTIGLAAGLFHPTTGYSLPDAVRTADLVAGLPDLASQPVGQAIATDARERWAERGYFRALNRMLFRAGEPAERYRVLEHFHRLPEALIARFYAGRLTAADKARILIGKPPVPVANALRVLMKGSK
ncbi:lycopene beta-cyclase CrtY [Aureimonas mangrovi]|uniref:lycopene beta-cyclase CrtY n=1 Tax=Aureimonas mangrovi TaxID=2758041 RepID=UPI00163D4CC6|nr:lycopene beta-cyclase CrtY [Aureimonas mangrovi]